VKAATPTQTRMSRASKKYSIATDVLLGRAGGRDRRFRGRVRV